MSTRATQTNLVAALPGLLLVCLLGFAAGGYLPGAAEIVMTLLAGVLVVWLALVARPLATFTRSLAIAAAAMALYSVWALASALWSDSTLRAVLDFDRGLLYLGALLVGALVAPSAGRMRWLVRGIALGGFIVCFAGFASRTLPDLLTTTPGYEVARLSFPLTYWNALGTLAAVSLILCLSIASDRGGTVAARALAAAAAPVLAATLILTLARGPTAATLAGIAVLVVVGFGPGMVSALVATVPACAAAIVAALGADLLTSDDPTTAAAATQGHRLLLVVGLAAAFAAVVMVLAQPAERRLPARFDRRLVWGGVGAFAAIALGAAVLAGGVGFVERSVDQFVNESEVGTDQLEDRSDRLTSFASNGRVDAWKVAWQDFERYPATGSGAGTFPITWDERRPIATDLRDAHSLYAENLAELGIVGLALLLTAIGTLLFGFLRRARGSQRVLYAGLAAAGVAWALEAGVDWIWEVPAVTTWLFFAGGAALAAPARPWSGTWGVFPRLLAGGAVALLCVLPLRIAVSQARLNDGLDAIERRDCAAAIDSSLGSLSAFGERPEPYALIGYCDARLGEPRLARAMLRRAVALDPDEWEYHYGYALVQASGGGDPRAEAREARARNPLEPMTEVATRAFNRADPERWRRVAARLPLPAIWGRPLG